MDDQKIVDLYWQRSEKAIEETDSKYGGYCFSIAYNVLANKEDAEESVIDTYMAAWNELPPHRPSILAAFLGNSPAISPSAGGDPAAHTSGAAVRLFLLWRNWMNASRIRRMWKQTISGGKPQRLLTVFWIRFRIQSAKSSCAGIGALTRLRISRQISDFPRAKSRRSCTGQELSSGCSWKRRALYEFQ